jgi:DNA-binding SARP family transcriptional activator/tetratricopeptide (TPR) repeat protein
MATEFRILGDIEVLVDGQVVAAGHARQRGVLAVLLVDVNHVVPTGQLVERVWGLGRTPANPVGAVQTYVSLLRRALADAADVTITRQAPGYKVVVDAQSVDLHRFRSLLAEASATSDDERAAVLMQQALGLWRGEPVAELDTPWINDIRQALALERHAARLDLADLQLRGGQHARMLADLSAQAAEHPLDERVAGQLMLALYHSGRQADALEHYQRIQRRLAEDLGVDPGSALRLLHSRILAVDPAPTVSAPGMAARPVVPRQLPAEPPTFIGRARELALLDTALDEESESSRPMVVSVIGGMGGVGKSWLALRWAHRHLDRFPDGQMWADLRGFDPSGQPTPPAMALRGFLDALGVHPAAVPTDLDAQAGLYRSLTTGRRMLIVLDNARDSAQVVPLLPGGAGCTVLVTSRHRLAELVTTHGARTLDLSVLPQSDARQLLTARLGRQRVATEPAAAAELLAYCAGLPLALSITAAHASAHPDLTLAALAAELRDHAHRLDALDAGEPRANLRAVLSWSHRTLSSGAARAFGLLGIAPGPDIALNAATCLLALPAAQTRTLLRELQRTRLLQQHAPDRYRMHELVRLYAVEQGRDDYTPADRQAALRRVVGFYLDSAHAGCRQLAPDRPSPLAHTSAPGMVTQRLPDAASALAWLDAEHACLLAAQQAAHAHGWDTEVWHLAWTLDPYHRGRGHMRDGAATWQLALAAARRLGDPVVQSWTHEHLGDACAFLGMTAEALEHLHEALALAEHAGDVTSRGRIHLFLANALEQHGDDVLALEHAHHALRAFEALGDTLWQAKALNVAGWFQARLGRYDQARVTCEAALALLRRHPVDERQNAEAGTLDSLGYIAHHLGEYDRALDYLRPGAEHPARTGRPLPAGRHARPHRRDTTRPAPPRPGPRRVETGTRSLPGPAPPGRCRTCHQTPGRQLTCPHHPCDWPMSCPRFPVLASSRCPHVVPGIARYSFMASCIRQPGNARWRGGRALPGSCCTGYWKEAALGLVPALTGGPKGDAGSMYLVVNADPTTKCRLPETSG